MLYTTLHKYRDYIAEIKFSKEDSCYYGKVIGIKDSITFEADNKSDVIAEFKKAVDDYWDFCIERGGVPDYPNCKFNPENIHSPQNIHLTLDDVKTYGSTIIFRWSSDIGFGEHTLYYDNEKDCWLADSEHMDKEENKEFLKELMKLWVNEIKIEE